tara:strand:- start:15177 stop:16106 length:930 start_codon:yes stop_codon:yes gene_type:complete
MRLLLLGCTGFIGEKLIPKLIKEGHDLCVVSRKDITQTKKNIPLDKISFLKLNLANKKTWFDEKFINQLRSCDGIINLIGEPIADKRWTSEQKIEIKSSRVIITKNLMENLKRLKINPKVIINASAIGFYGSSLNDEFTENSPCGNDFLANVCREWEEEALKKPFFTRLVIFRIGIVLGLNGGALGKMLPIFKIGLGGPIGDGNQWMSWIHRDDLCGLIANAVEDKRFAGVLNAVAPQPVKMKDFSKVLAKCLKRPNLLPVPAKTLKIILGDGAKLVLEGQKVISFKLKNKYKFRYPYLQEALYSLTKK